MLSHGVTRFFCGFLLFGLNLWICWDLLFIEYLPHAISIEPLFFALAREIQTNWPHFGWWRQWYCGMPFNNTYPPLLHLVVALTAHLSHFNVPRAFHVVVALAYSAGPVTVYAMMLRLSHRLDVAAVAGIVYSLWSPVAMLVPAIGRDIGGLGGAARLRSPVVYADSPYVFGLTLLPVAICLVDIAFEKRSALWWILGSLGIVSVLLTNIPAAISLAMALFTYSLAAERREIWKRLWLVAALSAFGYVLMSGLLPPTALMRTFSNTQKTHAVGLFDFAHAGAVVLLAIGLVGLAWMVRRKALFIRFALLFLAVTFAVVMSEAWLHVALLAEAGRFYLVMEMAIATAISSVLIPFVTRWRAGQFVLWTLVGCFCAVQIPNYKTSASRVIFPADITYRSERKIAGWMDQNASGSRVYVPGSVSFWLNWFTPTPQMIGCCTQNMLTDAPQTAYWMISADPSAAPAIAWLRALGVRYVAMSGVRSDEAYRATHYPDKFAGVLPLRWREGDDAIYEVPMRSDSLAHAMDRGDLVQKMPANGADLAPLGRYLEALESPKYSAVQFAWKSEDKARIDGGVGRREVISVQVAYHSGWSARANGRPVPIFKDGLGMMAIDPGCHGNCAIDLVFDGGAEDRFLRVLMVLSWLAAIWSVLVQYLFNNR